MKVNTFAEGGVMTVTVEGEINTLTTPELAKYVNDLSNVSTLVFDMENVPYVSSAGLRMFIACLKTLNASGGDMLLKNCDEFVAEIFESVGYDKIINIEKKNGTE